VSTDARNRLFKFLAFAGVLALVTVVMVANSRTKWASAGARSKPAVAPTVSTVPTRSAAPAPTPSKRVVVAAATAAKKPAPVVAKVRRSNVGAAHSPQLARALSGGPAKVTGAMPPGAGARGIDVASYQHRNGAVINWPQVAGAGYKFAFIKASEGNYYVNPYYASDLAQAKAAGLYVTGYVFGVPNVSSGASQADYAVQNAHYVADGRTMPLALDIEYNPYGRECYGLSAGQMVAWVASFTSQVRQLTGQLPIIYTTADWWRSCTGDSQAFGSDPLWIAGWAPSSPPMPSGWPSWTFWQYTSRGQVPGISGNVDVSYFGEAAVRLLDPGAQQSTAGTALQLQVRSLNATAGQAPAFTATGLPPGLSISGSGLISGTIPASARGEYAVTVTARNPSGGTGSVSFTWTITAPAPPPSPSPSPSSPSPSPSHTKPTPSPTKPTPTDSAQGPA
jgi:GH25 family lysozyme M1 (1,4-beta-N-acetylmuramidase)